MRTVNTNCYTADWKCLSDKDSTVNVQAEELFSRMSNSTVFSSPTWQMLAKDFIVENRRNYELNIYLGSELCGWLLISVGKEIIYKIESVTIRFVGYPLNDRMSFLLDSNMPDLISFMVNTLFKAPFFWDVAIFNELYDLDEKNRLDESLVCKSAIRTQWSENAVSPYIDLKFNSKLELYDSYSKSLKIRLRRAEKKINKKGEVEFKRLTPDIAEVDYYIDLIKSIEDKSWKGKKGVGLFSTEKDEKFFRAVAKSFAKQKWLDISFLYLDGKPISYRFGFSRHQTYYDYNLAFDDKFSKLSPGRLLLDKIIVSSLELGQKRVDSSRSSIKELHLLADCSKGIIKHHDLWIFKKTLKGYILFFIRVWLRNFINKKLKRNTR